MSNLFKKAVVFTDMHLGLKSNSDLHNEDCLAFATWMIKLAKEQGCETCFFCGDYHNNRASMNLRTMGYAVKVLELLSAAFSQVFFIPGNHDLYFRDKRDVQSAEWAKHIPNIHIVNDFFTEGDVSIVPWLVKDDHKKIQKIEAKYCFGHFELPHFYMNAMIQMPDTGDIQREHFAGIEKVYSGHFHKRQSGKNITYLGNCFPHNYSDAGDDERGCMVLEWGEGNKFFSWPDQPTYRVFTLSNILQNAETILKPKMHVRVNIDIDISYEEATIIKEEFLSKFNLREISLIPAKREDAMSNAQPGDISFKTVNQIVSEQILTLDSEQYDPKILLEIYNKL